MRRYAETFFHYWLILLVPIIVLPLIDGVMIKERPKTVLTSAKIWVDASTASAATDYNQYLTPAQNEAGTLSQLLQISSFDWKVAQSSAIYRQMLTKIPYARDYVTADLQKNMQFSAPGDNLVYVGYTSQDWSLGVQVVQSLLANAIIQMQQLSQQQSSNNISMYKAQLRSAQQNLNQSTHQLTAYMNAHNINVSADLSLAEAADPSFASLYIQVQSDQQTVQNLRQKILDLQTQNAGSSGANQNGYHVADPPSIVVVTSKKKELLEIALYLAIGLALSGGFVAAKTLLDRSLRYADEVPDALELPVLAVLPYNPALTGVRHGSAQGKKAVPHGDQPVQRRTG